MTSSCHHRHTSYYLRTILQEAADLVNRWRKINFLKMKLAHKICSFGFSLFFFFGVSVWVDEVKAQKASVMHTSLFSSLPSSSMLMKLNLAKITFSIFLEGFGTIGLQQRWFG